MNTERRQHLLAIIANASTAYKTWVETGPATLVPDDELYLRFQEIADQARVIFRGRAEPFEHGFLDFAPHWQAFVAAQQTTADATLLPSPELWEAWEALSSGALQSRLPKLKRIESIKQLVEEKVPRRQICMIYGFADDVGNPDFEKLEAEIAEPGKHTGEGTGWVAPVNRDLAAQVQQMEIEAETIDRKRRAKVSAAVTPAPESIESLVASGVSATQIAKLKRINVDAVFQYCDENNLPRPPLDYKGTLLAPALHDPELSAERRQQMDMLGAESPQSRALGPVGAAGEDDEHEGEGVAVPSGIDLNTLPPEEANQITEAVSYFNQGMDVAGIAAAMSVHGNKVRALLKKAGYNLESTAAS